MGTTRAFSSVCWLAAILVAGAGRLACAEEPTSPAGGTGEAGPSAVEATSSPAPSPPGPSAVSGTFTNSFAFTTADGSSSLRIGAAAHLDARTFFGDSVAPGGFDIRRARMDVQATMHGWMSLRLQAAMENSPYIRNAWLDMAFSDALHLQVGQMKVPFSTSWLTLDNRVNFAERAAATPLYPFFDRGVVLWGDLAGGRLTYQAGLFNGAGVDADATRGDIDDHRDASLRLFARPFKGSGGALDGLALAANATYGLTSVPTSRFDLRGLSAANFESLVWRWRSEQLIGTDGRNTDRVSADIDSRTRLAGELLYIRGPFTFSFEWVEARYDDITLYHDFSVGSTTIEHRSLRTVDGSVRNVSAWVGWYLTGETKRVDASGWRQPDPLRPFVPGKGTGWGGLELLARYSITDTDDTLFEPIRVAGYTAAELGDAASPVGSANAITVSILQGARRVEETTLGCNWLVNPNLRLQLNWVRLDAPDFVEGANGIVSGGNSSLADPGERNRLVESEQAVILRFIFKI